MSTATCTVCGRAHDGSYWWQGFCSRLCRVGPELEPDDEGLRQVDPRASAKTCRVCGSAFESTRFPQAVFCSRACREVEYPPAPVYGRVCVVCSTPFETKHKHHFICSDRCRRVPRGVERGSESHEYTFVLAADPCSYCGRGAGSIDHIDPVALGGSSGWENLTAACQYCNGAKGAKPLLTFLLGLPIGAVA